MLPDYLNSFPQSSVRDLIKVGHVSSSVDPNGNILISTNMNFISASLFSIPVINFIYNDTYLNSAYDPNFYEFTTASVVTITSSSISTSSLTETQQNEDLQALVTQLQDQLAATSSVLTSIQQQQTQIGSAQAIVSATQDLVVGLRIQLGQGSSSADFETTYPWRALNNIYTQTGSNGN